MTSLALLEHTATAAPPPFNGLFFATTATVIPVLLLALAVQGRTYEAMLSAGSRALHNQSPRWPRQLGLRFAGLILILIAVTIVLIGAIGEALAIWVLYEGQDLGLGSGVFAITLLLILAVAAGPILSYFRAITPRPLPAADQPGPANETQPPAMPGPGPDAATEAETGKPDPA